MSMTRFRRTKLAMLMEQHGAACHYCSKTVRLRVSATEYRDNDATLDHKVPQARGGTNADHNLILSCRGCNNAKAARSYEDFLARPYRIHGLKKKRAAKRPAYVPQPAVIEATKRADKVIRGTLAHAIQIGEVTEAGTYKRPVPSDARPPRGRKMSNAEFKRWVAESQRRVTPQMTALETARWLREAAERKGQPWPLA